MQMNNVGIKLKPESCFAISSNSKSGGLAMSCAQDIKVDNTSFSSHHIDAKVKVGNEKYEMHRGVWTSRGDPKKTHMDFALLVGKFSCSLWLCFGDFNEILHLEEKSKGNDKDVNWFNDFREAIKGCKLRDLGCLGHPFTWSNMRFGLHFIEERLDRFL